MAINTGAFIQRATMQMKAQNAPGEQSSRVALDKRAHRVVRWGQGALAIFRQTSAAAISTAAIRFLILLV